MTDLHLGDWSALCLCVCLRSAYIPPQIQTDTTDFISPWTQRHIQMDSSHSWCCCFCLLLLFCSSLEKPLVLLPSWSWLRGPLHSPLLAFLGSQTVLKHEQQNRSLSTDATQIARYVFVTIKHLFRDYICICLSLFFLHGSLPLVFSSSRPPSLSDLSCLTPN